MLAFRCRFRLGADGGASAVEFALILPLLVLFLFGIIEFGLAFSRQQGMEAAAREGARLAALGRDIDFVDVESAARNASPSFIANSDVRVRVNDTTADGWCSSVGDLVTVTVDVDPDERDKYRTVIPIWGGSTFAYSADGVFRCEAEHD